MTTAILWAWVHHSLDLYDTYDSLEDAVEQSWYMEEYEYGSFDCIEVWDNDGYRLIDESQRDKIHYEYQARKPLPEPSKPIVAKLWVQPPDSKQKPVLDSSYAIRQAADNQYKELSPLLGDRVWLEILE